MFPPCSATAFSCSVSVRSSPQRRGGFRPEACVMAKAEGLVPERRVRRWRSVAEKRRIVHLTLVPVASGASGQSSWGNANQVFKWRREFERGELLEPASASASSLPVALSGGDKPDTSSAIIHIEFQGRALISIESGADPALLRTILESLASDRACTGTKIWLAAGVTDMRRGFDGLSAQVQTVWSSSHSPVTCLFSAGVEVTS